MESHESANKLVGQVFCTNNYGEVRVLKYYNNRHVVVEFVDSGTISSVRLNNLKKGWIADPYSNRESLIYGVGYSGYGEYKKSTHKEAYDVWINMLKRCYSAHSLNTSKGKAYVGCTVCNSWHNFQNFALWYYRQYRNTDFVLDKDIIIKGNTIYAPDKCALIPKRINLLFERSSFNRGKLPIGVCHNKRQVSKPYMAYCNDESGKRKYLGYYQTAEDAFFRYKLFKEDLIKRIAEFYKDGLHPRVYDAMMKYEVEITD